MRKPFLRAYAARWGHPTAGAAEDSVVSILAEVASVVSRQWQFGYHEREDIEQEGILYTLEAIEDGKYDLNRPLDAFAYVHMWNRLFNLKRNTFFRSEAPCKCCEAFGPPEKPCGRWLEWFRRNTAKQALMRPVDVSVIPEDVEPNMSRPSAVEDDVALNELVSRIDAGLSASLRPDYLRMRSGVRLPRDRTEAVRAAVLAIIGEEGLSCP